MIVKPLTEAHHSHKKQIWFNWPLNDLRRKASNELDRAVVVLIFLFVTFVIVRLFDSLENNFTVVDVVGEVCTKDGPKF